jgi:predicted AAA+ superfamily ATPase
VKRIYEEAAALHFQENRQMLFLSGPRQVGKTFAGLAAARAAGETRYLNWDNPEHRRIVLAGPAAVAEVGEAHVLRGEKPVLMLDELHRFAGWKDFLKGFFDTYGESIRILVTGSARLDFFRNSGDSLMGRYFQYRMHPLSVAEIVRPQLPGETLWSYPTPIADADLDALVEFGGFPEPFARRSRRFYGQWRRLRTELLFKEDLRDLARSIDVSRMEVLARLLAERAGQLLSHSTLAGELQVSIDTVKRWLAVLESLHFAFAVRPWHRNVARALRKESKYYLWDWSLVPDRGRRVENLAAAALLKAVHFWTDHGLGEFELFFVRDKEKREVDFLVARDGTPWFLVEVKTADLRLSPALERFQGQTGARHAFQAVLELPHVNRSCFDVSTPIAVPLRTLLSQLV